MIKKTNSRLQITFPKEKEKQLENVGKALSYTTSKTASTMLKAILNSEYNIKKFVKEYIYKLDEFKLYPEEYKDALMSVILSAYRGEMNFSIGENTLEDDEDDKNEIVTLDDILDDVMPWE